MNEYNTEFERGSIHSQLKSIRMRTTGEDPNRNSMEMIRMSTIGEDPDSFGLSEGSEDGQLENIQTKSD